jgi:YidC/Oxa1 family membrane protein insertase
MDKQSTIAFILIGAILIAWLYLNSPEPQPVIPKKPDTTKTVDSNKTIDSTKKTLAQDAKKLVDDSSFVNLPKKDANIITIETDLSKILFSTSGGRIYKLYLKKYNTWYHDSVSANNFFDKHVQLVNTKNGGDFSLLFGTKSGQVINTAEVDFSVNKPNKYYKVSGDSVISLQFTYDAGNGKSIVKTYNVRGNNYNTKVDIELKGLKDYIAGYRYDVVWANGINFLEKNATDEANWSNASAFSGGEQVVIDATTEGEKLNKDMNGKVDWVGVRNKYFTVIMAPEKPSEDGGAYFEGEHKTTKYGVREYYSTSLKVPFKETDYQKDSFSLYAGPIDYKTLKSYGNNFEAIFDFGSFFGLKFIIRPISEYLLLPLMQFLHSFIPNYGFVIILFSILIKFALYPLSRTSIKSMAKMQKLQPKIAELKEKYKDDNTKVSSETMKLYSTYGVNPAGGCLPTLLQMPILIALYSLFSVIIDIRQQPFILWIDNLSAPDVIYRLPFNIPFFGVNVISGLALILGISMFLQQKQTMKDPSQKALIYMMPIMMTILFMTFPSGLNLYYIMFNLLTVGQQWWVNKHLGNEELVPVKQDPKKKKGFMARMMEAAEKQSAEQKKASGKRK